MPDTVKKIAHLILKYWRQELEEEELNELLDWANQSAANKETFARLTDPDFLVSHLRELTSLKQDMRDRIWSELQMPVAEPVADDPVTDKPKRKLLSISFTARKYIAAAVVLSAAGLLVFKLVPSRSVASKAAAVTVTREQPVPEEALQSLAMGSIRFADNSVLDPGTMQNGAILERGKLKLLKEPGGIRILSAGNPHSPDSALFNTINTGVGGGYTLWLPDGTEVQLNAASSLTFPVAFSATRRVVQASGELYFTVHKKPVPFFVHTPGMNMEVLGTRFNVHVFPEEKLATTTLEEGSLRVWKQLRHMEGLRSSNAKVDVVLVPGQQAQISNFPQGADMGGIRVEQVNVAEVVSWKTGQFSFSEMDCETMARQLSRWYGAKFEFPDGVPGTKFSGWFNRMEKLPAILQSLEGTGEVMFRLEQPGNRVIVTARQ
ncbi:MAG: FecR family protein [Chitinophagaceae bacterium]|nr:FecR family protein [Chitinophagaceae bacterium]